MSPTFADPPDSSVGQNTGEGATAAITLDTNAAGHGTGQFEPRPIFLWRRLAPSDSSALREGWPVRPHINLQESLPKRELPTLVHRGLNLHFIQENQYEMDSNLKDSGSHPLEGVIAPAPTYELVYPASR